MNRIIVLLLACLLLAGCTVDSDDPTTTTTTTPTQPTMKTTLPLEPVISVQYLPETVENPDSFPVLKWVCLIEEVYSGGQRTWSEEASHEVNRLLGEKNMPFRVQFVMVSMDQWLDYYDWFSRPEAQAVLAEADLIYGGMTTREMLQYLQPITEYVTGEHERSLKKLVIHDSQWKKTTVSGQIYGIPTKLHAAYSSGWKVDSAVFELGFAPEDFQKKYWEMDDVFASLYEKTGNHGFLTFGYGSYTSSTDFLSEEPKVIKPGLLEDALGYDIDHIGSCFAIDCSSGTPVVKTYFELDAVKQLHAAVQRYKAAGYEVNEQKEDAELVFAATCKLDTPYSTGNGYAMIPAGTPTLSTNAPSGYVSGISSTTRYKEEAVQLLQLIAEDTDFRLRLFFGQEGRDYQLADGYYSSVHQEDGSSYNMDFLSQLAYFCGLEAAPGNRIFRVPAVNNSFVSYEGKTKLETLQEMQDKAAFQCPAVFDYSGFEAELKAIEALLERYCPEFVELSDTQYDQMLSDIKVAGGDKILAELQQQLDAWLAENPDWNK